MEAHDGGQQGRTRGSEGKVCPFPTLFKPALFLTKEILSFRPNFELSSRELTLINKDELEEKGGEEEKGKEGEKREEEEGRRKERRKREKVGSREKEEEEWDEERRTREGTGYNI